MDYVDGGFDAVLVEAVATPRTAKPKVVGAVDLGEQLLVWGVGCGVWGVGCGVWGVG